MAAFQLNLSELFLYHKTSLGDDQAENISMAHFGTNVFLSSNSIIKPACLNYIAL